jgi:hypothetical protein
VGDIPPVAFLSRRIRRSIQGGAQMPLKSRLFQGDAKLEAAASSDPAHIRRGADGPHVQKIQSALMILDDATIEDAELQRSFYGPSTAASVLAYKRKRNIINRSYQTQADDIVGKMTIAALDDEMLAREKAEDDPRYVAALKALDEFVDYAKRYPIPLNYVEPGLGWRHLAEKVQSALVSLQRPRRDG